MFDAVVTAVEKVDDCVRRVVETGQRNGYSFLITADHGNADYMINEDGSPNTAHTTNPVPVFCSTPITAHSKTAALPTLLPPCCT